MKKSSRFSMASLVALALVLGACVPNGSSSISLQTTDVDATLPAYPVTVTAQAPASATAATAAYPPAVATETPTAPAQVTGEKTAHLIVYVNGRNLWASSGMETGTQLTTSGADDAPLLSPDGQWVLFQRELAPGAQGFRRYEYRLVSASGGQETALAGPANLPGEGDQARLPVNAAWAPDGKSVWFNTYLECGMCATNTDLWAVDVSGGSPRQVLLDGQGGRFSFSPDGKHLLIGSDASLTLADPDGQNARQALAFPRFSFPEGSFIPGPVWLADSSEVLVAIPEGSATGGDQMVGLWKLPVGGEASLMAKVPGMAFGAPDPAWSPDRAYFGYTSQTGRVTLASLGKTLPVDGGQGLFLGWNPFDGSHSYTYLAVPPDHSQWGAGLTLGKIGAEPQPLIDNGVAVALQPVRWLNADTFVYFAKTGQTPDGDGFELRVQTIGDDPLILFKSNDPYASRLIDVKP